MNHTVTQIDSLLESGELSAAESDYLIKRIKKKMVSEEFETVMKLIEETRWSDHETIALINAIRQSSYSEFLSRKTHEKS